MGHKCILYTELDTKVINFDIFKVNIIRGEPKIEYCGYKLDLIVIQRTLWRTFVRFLGNDEKSSLSNLFYKEIADILEN